MRILSLGTLLLALAGITCCAPELQSNDASRAATRTGTLVGRLLLPEGQGSRGVEVQALVKPANEETERVWIQLEDGELFRHELRAEVMSLEIYAGLEVLRIAGEDLPTANSRGNLDLGTIDLRQELTTHRLRLRAAEEDTLGLVRVALWFGLPPKGPQGESVSLGSRQFPTRSIGSEMEWLWPHRAASEPESVYVLVEHPLAPGQGTNWRSGRQQLFGPFEAKDMPKEIVID
jgi:hypothetical protein